MKKILGVVTLVLVTLAGSSAFAQGSGDNSNGRWAIALGIALTMGLAVVGGALAQGKAAKSALEGIARNPEASNKVLTPMIIALALIESLVIYALVIAFILSGKL